MPDTQPHGCFAFLEIIHGRGEYLVLFCKGKPVGRLFPPDGGSSSRRNVEPGVSNDATFADLIRRIRADDEQAERELVERYEPGAASRAG
jgi:hypothetical protein